MAAPKARIGVMQGQLTRPGINLNRRKYTPEAIAFGVADMQRRIDSGEGIPVTVYGSHAARWDDDVRQIALRPTKVWQADDGSAWYRGDVPDTEAGRELATLAAGGYAPNVSMAARWDGNVTSETDENGDEYETGERLVMGGWDFTGSPATPGSTVASVVFDRYANRDAATPAGLFVDSFDAGAVAFTPSPQASAPALADKTEKDMPDTPAPEATPEAGAPAPAPVMVSLEVAQQLADHAAKAAANAVVDALRGAPAATPVATAPPAVDAPAPAPVAAAPTAPAPANAATVVTDSQTPDEPSEAAVALAKEQLRDEFARTGVIPNRQGKVTDATAPAGGGKPLHEWTHKELHDAAATSFDEQLAPMYEARGIRAPRLHGEPV